LSPLHGGWLILVSLVAAMVLAVARVEGGPDWLAWLRPDWAVAVLFFWGVAGNRERRDDQIDGAGVSVGSGSTFRQRRA